MGLIITLIIVGILLIIAEIILIPGIFITGILGVLSLVASCYFAFTDYGQVWGIVTIAVNVLLLGLFVAIALRSKTWKKLSLSTNIESKADLPPEEKGIAIGQEGITITRLNPMGKVLIGDTTVEASTFGTIIDPQTPIRVSSIEDNKIFVEKR